MTNEEAAALRTEVERLAHRVLMLEIFMKSLALADEEPVSAFEARHRTFVDELRSGKAGV